jgi:hypothetical protein
VYLLKKEKEEREQKEKELSYKINEKENQVKELLVQIENTKILQ